MKWLRKLIFKQEPGRTAEGAAVFFLRSKGHRILESNYRCKLGEIDIISRKKGTVVFTEVKYRAGDRYGPARQAVGYKKQRRIIRVARHYIASRFKTEPECRFDVIGVTGPDSENPLIEHIEGAFRNDVAY